MLSKIGAAAALILIAATPAFADSNSCSDPIAPTAINGATATEQEMKDAQQDVKIFLKASDDYQSCMVLDLRNQKIAAAKKKDPKPLDPSIGQAVDARVDANQKLKERVGAEFNAAVIAYKGRHPGG
ncbi:MAG TPA: hypothetical protein VHW02_08940 [Rhizomicrobium sp.]|jgi:hypothetical protein|nr:hypothetical protein [Rhizomicrobium sp.]